MIDTKVIMEALGDAKTHIGKITLAAHMIDNSKMSSKLKATINSVAALEKQIATMEKNTFTDWFQIYIDRLNSKYKCGTRTSVIVTNNCDRVTIASNECVFIITDYSKETMEKFESKLPIIEEKVKAMAELIDENRDKVNRAIQKAKDKLRNQQFIYNKGSITSTIRTEYTNESSISVDFKYMDRERVSFTVYMNKVLDESAMSKEMGEKLVTEMERLVVKDRTKSIQQFIDEICKDYNLKNVSFGKFLNNTSKPWDFENGYISYGLDLSIENIKEKFIKDLINSTKAIEVLYFSPFGYLTSNKNIKVGDNCYYTKKDTAVYKDETYEIYECRVGTRKPINFLIKDGQRIIGRRKVRILKEIGLGRKKK